VDRYARLPVAQVRGARFVEPHQPRPCRRICFP
jgi:hypothetical protein